MSTLSSAESTASSETFHLFSRLPTELRLQIWRESLPNMDSPALVPYQSGCWRPVPVSESDEESDFHQTHVEVEFRHDLLEHIRVKIPLTAVNHEARGAAFEWALKQGIEARYHEDRQCLIFLRPFDPMRDVIWFGQEVHEVFGKECWGLHQSLADPRQNVSVPINLGQFAVSELAFMDDPSMNFVIDTFHSFCADPIIMYVIVGEHPNFDVLNGDQTKVQPRWELWDIKRAKALVWNPSTARFDWGPGRQILQELAYQRILQVSQVITELIGTPMIGGNDHFEIRPVFSFKL
ncbi:uncharacterized protein N7479_004672 [Penicillium vulpinum]|uniref:2EXR domain-containing protein n=1 Tax=Penicillium vulpinum TaxID=29845 RepID=A0A1V6RLX0_9EURO|nr:uncharacterized protein N7479_004672 [Penicillium vulpinum]KAJ5964796.1 hypothetical protein N7479_004672 [Penicillium vulpinum]OQE02842.1 hypothetical protein PENVUL_c038G06092 [Penicillium vulpinum]